MMKSNPDRSDFQIIAEIGALKIFTDHCDSAGLQIPGITAKFKHEYLDNPNDIFSDTIVTHKSPWPMEEYFDIMSLAQHYGLQTRLLDWSRNPYIAAYFAVAKLVMKGEEYGDQRFAVWALDIKVLPKNLQIITVPSANNLNIAAQQGVFTLLRQPYQMGMDFENTPLLDEYMKSQVTVQGRQRLVKISLPQKECYKIVDLCSMYGITAATLQPDFYGAAKATQIALAVTSKSQDSECRDVKVVKSPAISKLYSK